MGNSLLQMVFLFMSTGPKTLAVLVVELLQVVSTQ